MNSKNLTNKAEESEILSADEMLVSEFVGSLERVSAPKDFDFRLKTRIAAAEMGGRQNDFWHKLSHLLPVRTLAFTLLPVSVLAFLLAFVFYGTNFFAPLQKDKNFAETKTEKSAAIENQPVKTPFSVQIADASNANKIVVSEVNSSLPQDSIPKIETEKTKLLADKLSPKKKELQPKTTPDDNFKGSRDLGRDPANVQIFPVGIEPNKTSSDSEKINVSGKTSLIEMLKINGIEAVSEGGKLKVKSIAQNSPAERSDVKIGDVIESFDEDKSGANNSSTPGKRKLTVLRDGRLIPIELKLN